MASLPDGTRVPWHRVLNARGEVSERPGRPWAGEEQRRLLEREGIGFTPSGRVDLSRHLWKRGAR
jgi:methylated-DNA-protein-cysteine methyltransferase-like protein